MHPRGIPCVRIDATSGSEVAEFNRAGGEALVEKLLQEASLVRPQHQWRLRIIKNFHSSSLTPRVSVKSVQGHTVLLKLKPGDNGTAKTCALQIDHGGDPHEVQKALLAASLRLYPRPGASVSKYDPTTEAKAILDDRRALELALEAVRVASQEETIDELPDFASAVAKEFGPDQDPDRWTAAMAGLCAAGLLRERHIGKSLTGYGVTDAGLKVLVGEPLPNGAPSQPPTTALVPAPQPHVAPILSNQVIDDLMAQAAALASAAETLKGLGSLREQTATLDKQIAELQELRAMLDTEERELLAKIDAASLAKVAQLVGKTATAATA